MNRTTAPHPKPSDPFTRHYWQCSAKGCKGKTRLRYYGCYPMYYHPNGYGSWVDVEYYFWLCKKHDAQVTELQK